jgi:hypothetical protein
MPRVISEEYQLSLKRDKPNIFDKISQNNIDLLSKFVVKDIAIAIVDYVRYDAFNLMAEAIMMNVCVPGLKNYSKKRALSLQKKIREHLIKNFNKVLSRYNAEASYPLKRIVNLFKRQLNKNGVDSIHGDKYDITDFNDILYENFDYVNQRFINLYEAVVMITVSSFLTKCGIEELFEDVITKFDDNDDEVAVLSYLDMIWPHGKKRNFFHLPHINPKDKEIEIDYEEEINYELDSDFGYVTDEDAPKRYIGVYKLR